MANTLRVLSATREKWVKKMHDETTRSRLVLAAMRKAGGLKFNSHGTELKWTQKYKKLTLDGYADMEQLEWARNNLLKTATLPYRAYKMRDAISEAEKLQNGGDGDTQIVDLFKSKAMRMQEDAEDQLGAELYVDGNATGNEKRLHGLESFFGITTGSQVATDDFATVYTDTYGGLSTVLGNYGGSTTADEEYDFWTPTVVNVNKTGEAWTSHADQQIRRGILNVKKSSMASEKIDLIVLRRASFRQLLDLLSAKERLNFTRDDALGLVKFGFDKMIEFDGVQIGYDDDVPSTDANSDTVHGYGLNLKKIEFHVMGPSMWHASGDAFDETSQAFRFWIGFHGNLKAQSPRYFLKFAEISA